MLYIRWKEVDWALARSKILKWQQEIYLASKLGNIKKVRKYQKCIMRSIDAKLLAVRVVTQNIDFVNNFNLISPEDKVFLALSLVINIKSCYIHRLFISKRRKLKNRRLRISMIRHYSLQALFKLALEPEWEAKFQANSYGFRPGRDCHDAVFAIQSFVQNQPVYVLNAHILKCFDNINHEKLLDKIGMTGKYRKQLRFWLKSEVFVDPVDSDGILYMPSRLAVYGIFPLLLNIVLDGIDQFINSLIKDLRLYGLSYKRFNQSSISKSFSFVRYAYHFVVMHNDLSVISLIYNNLLEFLRGVGLELNSIDTRIIHTLKINDVTKEFCSILNIKPGFSFLGFYFRQYFVIHNSIYTISKQVLGFRTVIIPSKEQINSHQKNLHNLVLKQGKHMSQDRLIKKLNLLIHSWSNYFGKSDYSIIRLLRKMDYLLYLKLRQWAKRRYKTFGKGIFLFRKVGAKKWTFATDTEILLRHIDYFYPLNLYIKLKGQSNSY